MSNDPQHSHDEEPKRPLPDADLDISLDEDGEIDLQSLADGVEIDDAEITVLDDDGQTWTAESIEKAAPLPPEDPRADLEAALMEAENQIGDFLKRETELMDQQRRLAADFNNFRNRANRDIQMSVDQAEKRILVEILPVLDSFERSLESTYQDVDGFRSGVELIRKQFFDALRRIQVEPLPVQVGDLFDAKNAEALTTLSNPDLPDGAIAAVYEKGFSLREQLLRPARVVVNSLPSDRTSPGTSPGTMPGVSPNPSPNADGPATIQ
jgi:molecular chaperone GrpE